MGESLSDILSVLLIFSDLNNHKCLVSKHCMYKYSNVYTSNIHFIAETTQDKVIKFSDIHF